MHAIPSRRIASGRSDGPAAAALARRVSILRAFGLLGLAGLIFHLAHGQLGLGGAALNGFVYDWIYDGVILGGAVSCILRGCLIERDRAAWLLIGAGLAFSATGEIYYSFAFGDSGTPPIPSLADLFYLLYYPCAYAGLVLLARARLERLSASTWLDGAIAAATSAAVVSALSFEPILKVATQGDPAAVATNLAYPIGDVILLAIVVGTYALCGWRPGRAWLLLGIGLALSALADVEYLYQSARGTYVVGGILDSMWVAAGLVAGVAAWQRPGRVAAVRLEGRRLLVVPGVFALAALGVLLLGGFRHVSPTALLLAAVAVLLVFARGAWMFLENVKLLEASRRDALTDALTDLGNRRAMNLALAKVLGGRLRDAGRVNGGTPAVLVMFDLDGFKAYNDRFGHVAGDMLLSHLGRRLREAIGDAGTAYRIGGDEFCALLTKAPDRAEPVIAGAVAALCADGDGFTVTTSYGSVSIPQEAQTSTGAQRIADDRMYAQKGRRRGSARQQTHDVLVGVLREREPELHDHLREVGRLAVLVGRRMGMAADALDDLERAAELHDIGKAAVPDSILKKPGALSEHEWDFMRRHTIVGERILGAAPVLSQVALIVRSSHERWDGTGYPDRLAGPAIPLGARIVGVCDAFDAMTSDRAYAPAIEPASALAELRRNAGTQFDPAVVLAFCEAYEEHAKTLELEADREAA